MQAQCGVRPNNSAAKMSCSFPTVDDSSRDLLFDSVRLVNADEDNCRNAGK